MLQSNDLSRSLALAQCWPAADQRLMRDLDSRLHVNSPLPGRPLQRVVAGHQQPGAAIGKEAYDFALLRIIGNSD
jgi:hypothetical protein